MTLCLYNTTLKQMTKSSTLARLALIFPAILLVGIAAVSIFNVTDRRPYSKEAGKTKGFNKSLNLNTTSNVSLEEVDSTELYSEKASTHSGPTTQAQDCVPDYVKAGQEFEELRHEFDTNEQARKEIESFYQEALKQAQTVLSHSSNAEYLIVAGLLEWIPEHEDSAKEDGANIQNTAPFTSEKMSEYIDAAVAADPSNPVVLWIAAQTEPTPAKEDLLTRLSQVDSENGVVWMSLAATQWQSGDEASAKASLAQTAGAVQHSSYWVDSVELVARGLIDSGIDLPFFWISSMASVYPATKLPSYNNWFILCREGGEIDSEIIHLCLDYARAAKASAQSAITQSIATSLEISMLKALGDTELAQELSAAEEKNRQYHSKKFEDPIYVQKLSQLSMYMHSDPVLFQHYLDTMRQYGEERARQLLLAEKQRYDRSVLPDHCFLANGDKASIPQSNSDQ